jgi:hypothetical protein
MLDPAIKNLYEKLFEFKLNTELQPEYETQLHDAGLKLWLANCYFASADRAGGR